MTDVDIEADRAVVAAATPGPWESVARSQDWPSHVAAVGDLYIRTTAGVDAGDTDEADDATYIAHFDPAHVTALLDALAEARDKVERLRGMVGRENESARLTAEARDALADSERRWGLHQDVCVMASLDRENLETEAETLRAEVERLTPATICTCMPYAAGGDGPEEDCPAHGRPYTEWVARADAARAALAEAQAEVAEWRRLMARPHPGDPCNETHGLAHQDSCLGCERDAARAALARVEAVCDEAPTMPPATAPQYQPVVTVKSLRAAIRG